MSRILVLSLTTLFLVTAVANPNPQATDFEYEVHISGTHYKNLELLYYQKGDNTSAIDQKKNRVAADYCQKRNFKGFLAVYYAPNGGNAYVTDLFCSNLPTPRRGDDMSLAGKNIARAIIYRDRKTDGKKLHLRARNQYLKIFKGINIKGYTTIDAKTQ